MKSLITRLKPAHLKMGQSREPLPPECGKQGGVPASGLAKLLCTVRKTALVALWAARLREPAEPSLPSVNLLRAVREGAVGAARADTSVREERAESRLVRALAAASVCCCMLLLHALVASSCCGMLELPAVVALMLDVVVASSGQSHWICLTLHAAVVARCSWML